MKVQSILRGSMSDPDLKLWIRYMKSLSTSCGTSGAMCCLVMVYMHEMHGVIHGH